MKRVARIVTGSGLIVIGIPLLVLPGPGLLAIFAGITLVASEFEWASGIVNWAKEKTALPNSGDERSSDSDVSDD